MERSDDPDTCHIRIYQMLDRLEEDIDLLPFSGDGTIALVLRCFSKEVTGIRR
jgi:hypothetical protein